MTPRRPLRLSRTLEQLQIAEPCHESWEAMDAADGGKRFCQGCAKHVHDLSMMSRADATALVNGGESVCIRMERVDDGRVQTRDAGGRSWLRRVGAIAATLGCGSLFNVGCRPQACAEPAMQGTPQPITRTMGIVAQPLMGDVGPTTRETPTTQAMMGKPATSSASQPATTTQPTTKPATTYLTSPFDANGILPPIDD